MLVPVVSASQGHARDSGKEVNNDATAISYSILPAGGSSPDTGDTRIYPLSTSSISKGATKTSSLKIGSAVHSIEVDLTWRGSGNSLSIKIADPSNNNLGTYYDSADGKVDQRIHLLIYPPTGTAYMKQGTWIFTIKGESVSGTIYYTATFYTR